MLDLVREIRDRGETQILLSSHLLGDVEAVCDEVLILKDGRLAASCDLEKERRANRSFVEIELERPQPEFARTLVSVGCDLAIQDERRFKMVMAPEMTVRAIYEAARSSSAVIRRLDCKRDSLQDIFLKAMEADRGGV